MVSSEEVKGKVVAKDVVSMLRVTRSLSTPMGRVVLNPSSICSVAFFETINSEPRAD